MREGAASPEPFAAMGRLRIVTRVAAMLLLFVACLPFYYLWRLKGPHNPWPRIFLGGVARLAGVTVRVSGERVRQGAILIANHVSWIDIPAVASASGAAFVGHDGLSSVPLVRWLCALNDTVLVARHDRRSVRRQVEQVREAIRDTGALAIFPEGTTSDGTGLLAFKSSLLSAIDPLPQGIAVQPVLLDYGPEAAGIAWIGEEHGLDNFKRILARGPRLEVLVHFLPPLAGEALADRKSMAAAARTAILGELKRGGQG